MASNLIIQSIGFVAFLFIVLSVQKNKRSFTLIMQMLAAVFFTAHFILLDAWTGAAMNILAALRAYVFNLRNSKWYIDHPLVVYLFIDLFWIGGLLTWDGFHSILPVISLTLECFALWSKKTKYIRWILLSSFPFWTIYHIIVGSYAGIATESFVAISIIVSIIRFDVLKKNGEFKG